MSSGDVHHILLPWLGAIAAYVVVLSGVAVGVWRDGKKEKALGEEHS